MFFSFNSLSKPFNYTNLLSGLKDYFPILVIKMKLDLAVYYHILKIIILEHKEKGSSMYINYPIICPVAFYMNQI